MITGIYSYITVTLIILFAIACVRWIRAKPKPPFRFNDEMDDSFWLLDSRPATKNERRMIRRAFRKQAKPWVKS